jgi:hypothetical protein
MERERCHHCDRPYPTDEEWEITPEDEREDLCWFPEGCCMMEGVNWRERALKAEARCKELEEEIRQNTCICSSNPCEPYDDRCPVHNINPKGL